MICLRQIVDNYHLFLIIFYFRWISAIFGQISIFFVFQKQPSPDVTSKNIKFFFNKILFAYLERFGVLNCFDSNSKKITNFIFRADIGHF
ncbi:MAG: hypothetical protein RLZZ46_710 [Bacteroidota bacterium]|jgi:hypothetical protein